MIEQDDRDTLSNFFVSFYNQHMKELGCWIGKPNSEGVVQFIRDNSRLAIILEYANALRRLAELRLDEQSLGQLILGEFGSQINPTRREVPADRREESFQSWIERLSDLLYRAALEKGDAKNDDRL
jgi:hypothetical protein